ncbi:glycerol-3-phosphate dehydrogenase [Caedibacter taeniospiralis]|jgi:glycerol-3-phosphate dehydrogenase|uniref:glycerol-3-phosphate dehydrogenase n=1 Tax=Caedibacter taeniospiralis TaxID=28907 RepID=UPI0037C053BA
MQAQKKEILQADVLIIGGGINGTGVAVDASLRGLNVVLCEAKDLASATSSASSKLVHGGLRYLEQYEFKLVKEALREREVLLKKAPHIIHPLRFILPHAKHLRPVWMIRIGMFLYDFLAGKMSLQKSQKLSLVGSLEGVGLVDTFKVGFAYSDCRIDDARMAVFNAQQAQENGARVLIPYQCVEVKKQQDQWQARLVSKDAEEIIVQAKAVVNAGGPWVANIIGEVLETNSKSAVRLIKGSHIVVPKLYEGDHAYILQNEDGRIVFALPYGFVDEHQNEFTLIGTTDVDYQGDPREIKISPLELTYLCELINGYFKKQISAQDIVWSYAGVRPLYDDHAKNPSKITREYHLELEDSAGKLPLLSIFGGKITTYRTLSKHVVDKLVPYFPTMKACTTNTVATPGGEAGSFSEILLKVTTSYPWLQSKHAYRLASSYGMQSFDVLKEAQNYDDLGICFGYNLYQQEVEYLVKHEWVRDIDSLLWRRSKLGLWLKKDEVKHLGNWLFSFINKQQ